MSLLDMLKTQNVKLQYNFYVDLVVIGWTKTNLFCNV